MLLPFQERRLRLERAFRRAIAASTLVVVASMVIAMAEGRSALLDKSREAKWAALRAIGLEPERAEVDAYWADRRGRREVTTRRAYRDGFAKLAPAQRAMLLAGGMGPDEAVVRWGNYDMTMVFSALVFDRDDDGRYYRLRPDTRSILFRQINFLGLDTCQFYLPDTPEIRRLAEESGSAISPMGTQSTNSWGCRGPEPDMAAPVRGLVLGDSFMQGYLLPDDETPPMCLRRSIQAEMGRPTAILNGGLLGYGPEHYYGTLRDFGERFRPQFVIVAVYANDFGKEPEVFRGHGDWAEGGHWLGLIQKYCCEHEIVCLVAPVPSERQIIGSGRTGDYPGQVSNITASINDYFCDSTDQVVTENLRINLEEKRKGRPMRSLLYNGHLNDAHFSRRGAEFWGQVVGRRLALLLKEREFAAASARPGP